MPAVWVDSETIDRIQTILNNIVGYGACSVDYHGNGINIHVPETVPGGGSKILWAKITAVTDANNYTASIWTDRNETDPAETLKAVYVYDITDTLAINDWIPVQASNRTDIDYENIQQLGLL